MCMLSDRWQRVSTLPQYIQESSAGVPMRSVRLYPCKAWHYSSKKSDWPSACSSDAAKRGVGARVTRGRGSGAREVCGWGRAGREGWEGGRGSGWWEVGMRMAVGLDTHLFRAPVCKCAICAPTPCRSSSAAACSFAKGLRRCCRCCCAHPRAPCRTPAAAGGRLGCPRPARASCAWGDC